MSAKSSTHFAEEPKKGACRPFSSPSSPAFKSQFNPFVMQLCYQKQGWQHDAKGNHRLKREIQD